MTTAAETAGDTSKELFAMSDDDFLKMNSPPSAPAVEAAVETVETPVVAEAAVEEVVVEEVETDAEKTARLAEEAEAAAAAVVADDAVLEDDAAITAAADKKLSGEAAKAKELADKAKADATKTPEQIAAEAETARLAAEATKTPQTDAEKAAAAKAAEDAKPVDYEKFFKQIMTPFKANGRTIELKTPDEAIRLMQMGAGYGRKIQEMQPHLKVLRMLEKNDLLDPTKISLLIDVNAKNPDAIKKIIKDSGLDPLDLNMEDNVGYKPNNHAVSDKEMSFQTALKEVQDHPDGNETLRAINQTWDQESKSVLFESPELLGVIQSQRDNGIYGQIAAEIERQKTIGLIPASTPFLQAYKLAGDHLQASNGFKTVPAPVETQIQTQAVDTPATVIATRTAAPKPQVSNSDKAAAAAATKMVTQRKAATTVNPLEMADDDFLKQFNGRL